MKLNLDYDEDADVDMSPLIDCVFLLLIFFLVATMLKKWEMQIPVRLPDVTSNLSAGAEDQVILLGMNVEGSLYQQQGKTESGFPVFAPVDEVGPFLKSLEQDVPIRILAEREACFQDVINLLDRCQFAGFEETELKLLSGRIRIAHEGRNQ